MKIYINNWLGLAVSSLLLLTSLNSCVKNRNDLATDFSKLTPIVELIAGEPITTGNPVRFRSFALPILTTPTTLNIYVNYAAPGLAPNDITVTLALDPVGLAAYDSNNAHLNPPAESDYVMAPSDAISLTTTTVTIKKGERFAVVPITVNTSKIDLSQANAIAIKIVDASGVTISANNEHIIYAIGVKNKYDGLYDLRQRTTGWAAYGIADGPTFDWGDMGLVTLSANSVEFSTGYFPGFDSGGGQVGFGATEPQFTFDLATDKLIDVHNLAAPDSRNRQFVLNPAVTDSRFDPATKTVYMAYIFTQSGRPPQFVYDTLTYIGVRP